MKLIKLSSTALLAMLAMGTATTVAYAAEEGGAVKTTGDMTYHAPIDPIPPKPVDPINPDVNPGPDPVDPVDPIGGSLSIDFASTLHFGDQEITTQNRTYNATGAEMHDGSFKPNWAQVTDVRGTLAGWNLTLAQDGQFANEDPEGTPGHFLEGAKLTFNNGHLVSNSDVRADFAAPTTTLDAETGAQSVIMSASAGTGSGTNLIVFGDDATKDKSITLDVPGKTTKLAKKYTTSLTWTLSNTPAL